MAFLSNADLRPVARLILEITETSEATAAAETKAWCSSVFTHACRQIECFIQPEVSVAAHAVALSRGYELSKQRWGFQDYENVDGERTKLFHWEHVLPVAELKRRIVGVVRECRTVEVVEELLRLSDITWILKSENTALDRNKFRHERPGDPWTAYRELEIRVVGKPW